MGIYRIEWKTSALKELKQIDKSIIPRILNTVEELAKEPRPKGVRKLQGSKKSYRIRVGDYRIVYEIEDDILLIIVIRVRHRRSAYNI